MKRTYVYIDGEFVEKKRDEKGQWHYVQGDIQPYQSMVDGTMITSRSQHRNHLRRHNCIEVGDEYPTKLQSTAKQSNTRLERLRHEVNTRMTNDQADRLLRRIREQLNFTHPHRSR